MQSICNILLALLISNTLNFTNYWSLQFHHRDPHLVGLLSSDNIPAGTTVYYGMITDGIHTDPAAIRIAHRTHPEGGLCFM